MARSSGPQLPQVNQWADQGVHPDYAHQGYGLDQGRQPTPPAPPAHQQGFSRPVHGQQPQYAQPGHAHPQQAEAYHYPDSGHPADSYSQPTLRPDTHGHGAQAYQQPVDRGWAEQPAPPPSYAPQFEPYTPPTAPPGRVPPTPRHHNDYAQPAFAPPEPPQPSGYGAARDPRIVTEPPQHSWQQAPELRGAAYDDDVRDAGGRWQREPDPYAAPVAAPPPSGYANGYAQPGYAPQQPQSAQYGSAPAWQGEEAYQGYDSRQPHGYPHGAYAGDDYAGQGYGNGGYAEQYQEQNAPDLSTAQGYAPPATTQSRELEGEYDPDEVDYEDEGRGGGRKKVLIAAALAGAVLVSGGLAYVFLPFSGSAGGSGTPVVKSESQPSKFKPIDAGGKKFAHTDSKVLGRLNDGSSAVEASSTTNEDGSPRKVTTMIVGRDGSIVPSSGMSEPPPGSGSQAAVGPVVVTPPPAASPVPGLTIVDGFGGRGGPVAPVASAAAPVQPARVAPVAPTPPPAAAPPARVQVISRAEPRRPDPVEADPAPQPPTRQKPAEKAVEKKPVRQAAVAPNSMSDAAPASGGAAGYVAVLASIPESASSRIDALKQFADLQQRYPSQLRNKTPDVQSASVSGKGNYHRLVVGPPGSRQQATDLCAELKTVGYTSCWIKAY